MADGLQFVSPGNYMGGVSGKVPPIHIKLGQMIVFTINIITWGVIVLTINSIMWGVVVHCRVDAFRPEGCGFESRSSRHVETLGKSFTCSCL